MKRLTKKEREADLKNLKKGRAHKREHGRGKKGRY